MILADTSIWIDHLRAGDPKMIDLLNARNVMMHPLVACELAMGHLSKRAQTLRMLDQLPTARTARLEEVRSLIETRALFGRGIGALDVHLLASTLITRACRLWTRDKRLKAAAVELGVSAEFR